MSNKLEQVIMLIEVGLRLEESRVTSSQAHEFMSKIEKIVNNERQFPSRMRKNKQLTTNKSEG